MARQSIKRIPLRVVRVPWYRYLHRLIIVRIRRYTRLPCAAFIQKIRLQVTEMEDTRGKAEPTQSLRN